MRNVHGRVPKCIFALIHERRAGGEFKLCLANLRVDVLEHFRRLTKDAVLPGIVHERVGEHEQNITLHLTEGTDATVLDLRSEEYTVSGQNTIGIYITPLVLIQPTDVEQNAVNNNWLLKLQPAVKLQSWQKSNFS